MTGVPSDRGRKAPRGGRGHREVKTGGEGCSHKPRGPGSGQGPGSLPQSLGGVCGSVGVHGSAGARGLGFRLRTAGE